VAPNVLPRIAITLGDPAGIGPEIALKAVLTPRVHELCRPVLVGDARALRCHAALCGLDLSAIDVLTALQFDHQPGRVPLLDIAVLDHAHVRLGEACAEYGRAGLEFSRAAISAALAGQADMVVIAPQNETSITLAGIVFDGNPSFLARCTGVPVDQVFLMLCFDNYRITHVTGHLSLRAAIDQLSIERIVHALRATDRALRQLGIDAPRIAVSGLNPHAGEGGIFGREEIDIITPAIRRACELGLRVEGPYGADIMFSKIGFDAFVVMYHDQGHVLAKTLAPNRGAALSIGTPVLLSSVAHGTAFDIAGKNLASAHAIITAIECLVRAS